VRTIIIGLLALAGCIDEFQGSELQIDFSPAVPVQSSSYRPQSATELPDNVHFTLYAYDETMDPGGGTTGRLFAVQDFEIHRVVDLQSPCYIDVGEHVPFPGLHVSQYVDEMKKKTGIDDPTMPPADATEGEKIDIATAFRRGVVIDEMAGVNGPKAITSASPHIYPALAANCTDTNGIPPPDCVEPDANQRRLELCQSQWDHNKTLFEGTDRVLTAPLNGTTYGLAIGTNPANLAPVGGSAFFVDEVLTGFDGFAIYWQYDDADKDGKPDYPASVPVTERTDLGTLFLFGTSESPTRGVIRAHMTSITSPQVKADLAIFADIGDDDVHF
jgi:hypothetical protein